MVGRGEAALRTIFAWLPARCPLLPPAALQPMPPMPPAPAPHAAKKKSAAMTAALLRFRIRQFYALRLAGTRMRAPTRSGQGNDVEVEDAGRGAREDDGVVRIEQVELLDAFHRRDAL